MNKTNKNIANNQLLQQQTNYLISYVIQQLVNDGYDDQQINANNDYGILISFEDLQDFILNLDINFNNDNEVNSNFADLVDKAIQQYNANKNQTTEQEKQKILEIQNNCQVDNYNLTRDNNNNLIMTFSIYESDCEYYFESYEIKQDFKNHTNIINVTKILNKPLE